MKHLGLKLYDLNNHTNTTTQTEKFCPKKITIYGLDTARRVV